MPVSQNDRVFGPIANEFVVRFVEAMARQLHSSELVAFSLDSMDEASMDLLFKICFFGVAQSEELSGFRDNGTRYTPRVTFETDAVDGMPSLLVGDTIVHALVDKPALQEGIRRAQS